MSPTFSTGKLRRMFHHISTGAQALVEHLKEKKAQGQAVELKHVVSCFTMDVIASTGFSVQINSFKVSSDQRIFQDPSENLGIMCRATKQNAGESKQQTVITRDAYLDSNLMDLLIAL